MHQIRFLPGLTALLNCYYFCCSFHCFSSLTLIFIVLFVLIYLYLF